MELATKAERIIDALNGLVSLVQAHFRHFDKQELSVLYRARILIPRLKGF